VSLPLSQGLRDPNVGGLASENISAGRETDSNTLATDSNATLNKMQQDQSYFM